MRVDEGWWGLMRVYEGWWGLMRVDEGWWGLMRVYEGLWGFMRVYEGWWGLMRVDEGWWGLMRVDEGWWGLMRVDEGWWGLIFIYSINDAIFTLLEWMNINPHQPSSTNYVLFKRFLIAFSASSESFRTCFNSLAYLPLLYFSRKSLQRLIVSL